MFGVSLWTRGRCSVSPKRPMSYRSHGSAAKRCRRDQPPSRRAAVAGRVLRLLPGSHTASWTRWHEPQCSPRSGRAEAPNDRPADAVSGHRLSSPTVPNNKAVQPCNSRSCGRAAASVLGTPRTISRNENAAFNPLPVRQLIRSKEGRRLGRQEAPTRDCSRAVICGAVKTRESHHRRRAFRANRRAQQHGLSDCRDAQGPRALKARSARPYA